jgi:tricorn protease
MLGEISNSHTYVGGGDDGDTTPSGHAALLGVDWALDAGLGPLSVRDHLSGRQHARRLSQPAAQPGLNVKAGDYLLAVNGVELQARPPIPTACCSWPTPTRRST